MTGSKLKIDIRRNKIVEHLRSVGKVSVMELSELLDVTPVTIRNDLANLEQDGCLMRVQGGAVQIPSAVRGDSDEHRLDVFREQKEAIAAEIVKMIRDGDTLFMNCGTTCEYIAEALRARRNLNIVTNSLRVATRLGSVQSFRVLLIGGEINARYGFTYGGDAQEQLGKYQANWAILSVDGVSSRGGITTHHAEEALIDRMMVSGARQTLIAADASKIGRAGFSRVCECSAKLMLVTNEGGNEEALSRLQECGLPITLAK